MKFKKNLSTPNSKYTHFTIYTAPPKKKNVKCNYTLVLLDFYF